MPNAAEVFLLALVLVISGGLAAVLRPPGLGWLRVERALRRWGVPLEPSGAARRAAEERAAALLRAQLGDDAHALLARRGYLEVASPTLPDRIYRVPQQQGVVDVVEGGILTMRLCVAPTRWVPDADVVLMHKLLIEGDEARYLRVANRFPAGSMRLLAPRYRAIERRAG